MGATTKAELWAKVRREPLPPRGRVALPVSPCKHGGTDADIIERCPSCAGGAKHVRECGVHGTCTHEAVNPGVMDCARCRRLGLGYTPDAPAWDRAAPLRFDHTTLYPELPGKRFNPGLVAWGDGYAFAWRDGWAGSDVWVCQLDRGFRPVGPAVKPVLTQPGANYGREDPQLFVFGGRLHVAYVGVEGGRNRVFKTNVLYARLKGDFTTDALFAPKAPGVWSGQWQKNWSWFEHAGQLYALYSISPHRVLRVTGSSAEWAAETAYPHPWRGGELRGGATPARHGDEWWSFFHDSIDITGRKRYRVGLYAFEARPPFRVTRFVPYPIAAADLSGGHDNYCDVLFPRGAVRDGPNWLVSCGVHDRWSEVLALPHADLESQLVSVGGFT